MSDNGGEFLRWFRDRRSGGRGGGIAAGSASGEEMRRQIGDKSIELKEQAQKLGWRCQGG